MNKAWRVFIMSSVLLGSLSSIGMPVLAKSGDARVYTLEEKIGQMIMIGFRGTRLENNPVLARQIEKSQVGSVILYDKALEKTLDKTLDKTLGKALNRTLANHRYTRNIKSPEQLQTLTENLQQAALSANQLPLLIAADYEGGKVAQLTAERGFPKTLSQNKLARYFDEQIYTTAMEYAETLKNYGINYVLGPVVDVAVNQDNPVIVKLDRAFSNDPWRVSQCAALMIRAYQENRIACALKHFPGHGSSQEDSHVQLADITASWDKKELIPYWNLLTETSMREKITNPIGVTVMTGHLAHSWLDDMGYPASLSQQMMAILRDEMEFGGVVISDDLQMKAIAHLYDLETTVKLALQSGHDILLFSNQMHYDPMIPEKVNKIIQKLIQEGDVSEAQIDHSFKKIQSLKKWVSGSL